jgi:hypothetical protein
MTGMSEKDLRFVMEVQKILREGSVCCDKKFLEGLLQNSGRPPREVDQRDIRWIPYNKKK